MPTPDTYEILEDLLDKGLSRKEGNELIDLYERNGTLYAQTPIEVQRRYPAGISGIILSIYDENPTYIKTLGEIRSDDRSGFQKTIDRILSFLEKKKMPNETRPEWQPDNNTIFHHPNAKKLSPFGPPHDHLFRRTDFHI